MLMGEMFVTSIFFSICFFILVPHSPTTTTTTTTTTTDVAAVAAEEQFIWENEVNVVRGGKKGDEDEDGDADSDRYEAGGADDTDALLYRFHAIEEVKEDLVRLYYLYQIHAIEEAEEDLVHFYYYLTSSFFVFGLLLGFFAYSLLFTP